jgi:hypothetical protein
MLSATLNRCLARGVFDSLYACTPAGVILPPCSAVQQEDADIVSSALLQQTIFPLDRWHLSRISKYTHGEVPGDPVPGERHMPDGPLPQESPPNTADIDELLLRAREDTLPCFEADSLPSAATPVRQDQVSSPLPSAPPCMAAGAQDAGDDWYSPDSPAPDTPPHFPSASAAPNTSPYFPSVSAASS